MVGAEQNAFHITLTSMKTQTTTTKCTLCGQSTNHKTYYIAEQQDGLIVVTRCLSPDLKAIQKVGRDHDEAMTKARGLIALRTRSEMGQMIDDCYKLMGLR